MKRDWELVRRLLNCLRLGSGVDGQSLSALHKMDIGEPAAVRATINWMVESQPPLLDRGGAVVSLTWEGHELADMVCDPGHWAAIWGHLDSRGVPLSQRAIAACHERLAIGNAAVSAPPEQQPAREEESPRRWRPSGYARSRPDFL